MRACGVCRTDLHVVDGELPSPKLPLVPGHQIVGETDDGRRLGVPWLGWTCGDCRYCTSGRENLCDRARFTGYDLDGGYAEWAVADERFCFPIPDGYGDLAGRAAALRRADRLPLAAPRRRRGAARPLRLRRGRAHRRAGGASRGAASLRVHPRGRRARRRRSRARSAPSGPASGRAARAARRGDHLRAGRASSCPRRCAPSRRAAPSSAPAST